MKTTTTSYIRKSPSVFKKGIEKCPMKKPLRVIVISLVLVTSGCIFKSNRPPATPVEIIQPSPTTPLTPSGSTLTQPADTETISAVTVLQFVAGRNDYTITVDDTPREFILYVPSGYDPSMPTPIVIMLHGSNQHPNNMYENTNWVKKAEEEVILVVFPASWKYPLLEDGKIHEKWNTVALAQLAPPGTEFKDDVKFIRTIIEDLKVTFNIDNKRIFASGFSNGGGFVITRLIPEMNDVFAAYSTGGAGLLGEAEVNDVPITVSASLYSVIGTNDNKIAEGQDVPVPFPFAANDILNDPLFNPMFEKTTALLGLEMSYAVESQSDFTRFTFNKSLTGVDNEYVFMMIKGLFHVYPSGDDNRSKIDAADLFWDFFLKHAKP